MSDATPSEQSDKPATDAEESATQSTPDSELAAQLDLLAAENSRLRELLAERQRSRYQNTAIGLFAVGLVCGVVGYFLPAASAVLFALAGTGIFGGVLTYFLTPERFISADVGQRVYSATAQSFSQLCEDLGLSDQRVYIVADSDNQMVGTDIESWLFIPQTDNMETPDSDALELGFIIGDEYRGLAVQPTGNSLFATVRESLTEPIGTTPETICTQLSDALVEDFELAKTVEYDADEADGRVSVRCTGALYGDGTQFDHPIVSLIAVGLATGLDTPIETTVTEGDPLAVTFRWDQH